MTPDDARAALDAALPCAGPPVCPSTVAHVLMCPARYRAAVWPIIDRLVAERNALDENTDEIDQIARLRDKLAAAEARIDEMCTAHEEQFIAREKAEAERDHWAECNTEWADTATKHAVHIAELEEKLAQAEADLAACQNVVRVVNAQNDALTIRAEKAETERDELNDLLNIAEQGGACAK